jgi:hypothetical protein
MGGGQSSSQEAKDYTDIITKSLSSQVTSLSQNFSSSVYVNQTINNSKGCINYVNDNKNTTIVCNTYVFNDQEVYQTAINDITSKIAAEVDQKTSGLFSSDQLSEIKVDIQSAISTIMTAEQLSQSSETANELMVQQQSCLNSKSSANIIIGNSETIFTALSESYSKNKSVQDASNTISNIIDMKTSQTKVGLLSSLFRTLAVVFLILCVIVVVFTIVFVYTIGNVAKAATTL